MRAYVQFFSNSYFQNKRKFNLTGFHRPRCFLSSDIWRIWLKAIKKGQWTPGMYYGSGNKSSDAKLGSLFSCNFRSSWNASQSPVWWHCYTFSVQLFPAAGEGVSVTARGRRCCRVWSDHALPWRPHIKRLSPAGQLVSWESLSGTPWCSLVLLGTPSPHHQQHVQTGKGRIQTVFITRDLGSSKPLFRVGPP